MIGFEQQLLDDIQVIQLDRVIQLDIIQVIQLHTIRLMLKSLFLDLLFTEYLNIWWSVKE